MTVGTLDGLVKWQIAIALNDRYRYGSYDCSNRCDPLSSGCADCSGFQVAGWASQGVYVPCSGSFAQSRLCHRLNLGVPVDQARAGDLLFIGANEGQGALDGSKDGIWSGHVARKCLGPRGEPSWVVEARNHRAGITWSSAFYGRGWSYAAHDPYLAFTPPVTPDIPGGGAKLIASARNKSGSLEVFQIMPGGGVRHRWQQTNGHWSAWQAFGGSEFVSITASTNTDGRLEVFATDAGQHVSHRWQQKPGADWTNWTPLA